MRWTEFYGRMDRLVPVNGLDSVFSRLVWDVYKVRVIRNEWGDPLGFCAIGRRWDNRRRRMLPDEFFNHELVDVDVNDVDALAEFMEEYGFLGHHFLPTPITFQRFIELDSYLDKDVDYFEAITHFSWRVDDRYEDYFEDPAPGFYRLLWHELKRVDDALREQQPGVSYSKKVFICGVASIERVVGTIKKWRRCSTIIKLLIKHQRIADIAKDLGLEVNQACDCLDRAVRSVNEHIGFLSPTIEIYDEGLDCFLMGATPDQDVVGLEEAIAVQLWRFSLEAKEGYSICRECGRMFVRKRSKTAKAASRSTSQFCCDRCKNRNAQRRHRKSPGYLQKHSEKKAPQGSNAG